MKKFLKSVLGITLVAGIVVSSLPTASAASKLDVIPPATDELNAPLPEGFGTVTVIEEYDVNGKVIETTVIEEGASIQDVGGSDEFDLLKKDNEFSINKVVDPGSMNYRQISSWYGDSGNLKDVKTWAIRFGASAIPAGLTKNTYVTAASTAAASTFYKPPATRYYATYIYEAADTHTYFGKTVSNEYSNSARTNKTRSLTKYYTQPKS